MSERTTAQQRRVWQNFLVLSESVSRETVREMQEASGLSGPDFTVLAHLSGVEDRAMRSTDLACALGWDTSRTSHHLRRMEQRDLIRRCRGTGGDGRAALVAMTDDGLAAYRRALGPHFRSIKHWFLDGLDGDQLDRLDAILASLQHHLDRTRTTDPKETS
ncbi:MarR family winged helix-turn-helix transcriptional regulator [Glycomyces sp. NPDC047369]